MVSPGPERRRKGWLLSISVLSCVLLALLIVLVSNNVAPSNPPGGANQLPAPSSISPAPPLGDDKFIFELFDDFSGSTFDSSKWEDGARVAPFIYLEGGSAHIQAPPAQVDPTGDSATLPARLPRPVSAVRFEIALLSANGPNSGGAYVVVSRQGGRNHKVVIGPDSQGFPAIRYYICARDTGCPDGVYGSFAHPAVDFPVHRQQRYEMAVYESERGWVFEVDGKQQALADLERGPIRNLSLFLYSSGEGTFHAAVDDIFVAYAA